MQASQIHIIPFSKDKLVKHSLPLLILLSFFFSSCSATKPELKRPFLPIGYRPDTVAWTRINTTSQTLYILPLNLRNQLNHRVLQNWRDGFLKDAFIRAQPLSTVHKKDISNLSVFINHLYTIFLVAINSKDPISQEQLQGVLRDRLKCDPLTNLEIRFQMNAGSQAPFSRKPLTILMITGHELSLLSGAKPIYPQVFSPYLRDKLKLPSLGHPEDFNLFAAKNKNKLYSTPMNGFIVCERRKTNFTPKK